MECKSIQLLYSSLLLATLVLPSLQHGHNYGGSSSGSFSSASSGAYSSAGSGAVVVDEELIKDIAQGIKGIINSAQGYGGGTNAAYSGSASGSYAGSYGGAYAGGQGGGGVGGGNYGGQRGAQSGASFGGGYGYGNRKPTHNTGNYGSEDNVFVATVDDNGYGSIVPDGKPGQGGNKPTVIVVTSIGTDADTGAGVLVPQPGKSGLPAPGGSIHDSKPTYVSYGYPGTGPQNLPGPPGSIHDSKPAYHGPSNKPGQIHYTGPFPGPPGSIHDSKPAGPGPGQSRPNYNVPSCNKQGNCNGIGNGNSGQPNYNVPSCNKAGGCNPGGSGATGNGGYNHNSGQPNYNVPSCNKAGGCNPGGSAPTGNGGYSGPHYNKVPPPPQCTGDGCLGQKIPIGGQNPSPEYPYTSKPPTQQNGADCPSGGCKPVNSYNPPPSGIPPGFPKYPSRCTDIACFLDGKKPPSTNPDLPPDVPQKPANPANDYGSKPVHNKPTINPYQPTGSGTCTGGSCVEAPTNDYGSKPCQSGCGSGGSSPDSPGSKQTGGGSATYDNGDFVFADKDSDYNGGSYGFGGGLGGSFGANAGASGGKSLSHGSGAYQGNQNAYAGGKGGSSSGAFSGSFATASASAHASAGHY